MHHDARRTHALPVLWKASVVITMRKAATDGMRGLQCGSSVKCADCGTGMQGFIWYAERLVAMHHTEPVVELLCLPCARIAKLKLVPKEERK